MSYDEDEPSAPRGSLSLVPADPPEAPVWLARRRELSRRIRAGAGYRCWIVDCARPAGEVDHLIPPAELAAAGQLGRFFDPAILRPSCRHHNASAAGRIERDRQIERLRRGEVVVAPRPPRPRIF
jgi:hypothetical protein